MSPSTVVTDTERNPPLSGEGAALAVRHVSKAFGATRALRDCSFTLERGEVHAIVGENGSGKSTFVKICSGVHRPDSGSLQIRNEAVAAIASPRDALAHGIVTVFQEVLTADPRPVLDNVWLGHEGILRQPVDLSERRRRADEIFTQLLGKQLDLDRPVEELTLSDRQACCIARALLHEPEILILDESTSALDIETRDRLFAIIRSRASSGMSTVFISHRMDEVQEIGEKVTVMRSGVTVAANLSRTEATIDELVRHMTGGDHLADAGVRAALSERSVGAVALRARAVKLAPEAAPIDIEIRSGELVGLAGLEGHGQDAFLAVLAGAAPAAEVWAVHAGSEVRLLSPRDASGEGVLYAPRERRAEALFSGMSVTENFSVQTLKEDTRGGLLRPKRSAARLREYVARLGIVLGSVQQPIDTLSGGNQQKVVIARLLAAGPRVLLLNDPTRGIDLNAKHDLYALLTELAAAGVAIVMLSSEVDEHVELMDRVLVFRERELFCELNRDELDRTTLIRAFFGRTQGGDDA